jgi:putative two-component system hydrogenase maturation factor HypX/HoxX
MRLLLLSHLFNGLTQRLFVELRAAGHELSVEFDIADSLTEEAVALWQPEVVIAPFLKRRIPESVWSRRLCLVVHPGPPGDRGPSALDWAVLRGDREGGVTVLQAIGEYDAGPVWAWRPVALRAEATKSSLYRREVTQAAVAAVFDALARVVPGGTGPQPPPALPPRLGGWQPPVRQADRALDWARDDAAAVLRRIRSADGAPGLQAELFGSGCRLYDAHPACADDLARAPHGAPGVPLARRGPALLLRTADGGGVWIGHVRRVHDDGSSLKLAATRAFAAEAAVLPELPVPLQRPLPCWDELHYREFGAEGVRVGVLGFGFHNGAMSTRQAGRLRDALRALRARPLQLLVLEGGEDFFCNGIHLHEIEAATLEGGSAADASMRNIEAIDDVVHEILTLTDRLTIALLRGSAGAGGCFVALAADEVWAFDGVLLNPHYKNMGNLYGSEYWTYTLPRRVGEAAALALMRARLPLGAAQARAAGLVDVVLAPPQQAAVPLDAALAAAAQNSGWRIADKAARRAQDEARRPLAAYRAEELQHMHRNFYGFDPSYHVARHHFVHRKAQAWTPRHLAVHRDGGRR